MIKKYTQAKAIGRMKDGRQKFRLTAREVDRYSEVVESKGIQTKNFAKNPIVLWGHGAGFLGSAKDNVPIGKIDMKSMEITDNYVDADVVFDTESGDAFAEMIAKKVENGFLNAGSIGFRPITVSSNAVKKGQKGKTITEWELLEFSIVAIPALPSALAKNDYHEYRDEVRGFLGEEKADTLLEQTIDEMFGFKAYGEDDIPVELPPEEKPNGKEFSSDLESLESNFEEKLSKIKKRLEYLEVKEDVRVQYALTKALEDAKKSLIGE